MRAAALFGAFLIVVADVRGPARAIGEDVLPLRLESYLSQVVPLTIAERRQLLSGAAVTKLVEAEAINEVAVFGAVWINGSPQQYVAAVRAIETFEQGGSFRTTRAISTPARREDFADLRLPDDVDDLDGCRVTDCAIKMDAPWIQRLRAQIDFKKPSAKAAVDALLRDFAYEFVTAYQQEGNAALPVYADKPRLIRVEQELTSMTGTTRLLTHLPALRQYLFQYPRAAVPNVTDFFYWQDVKFGLKPTIRINHMVVHQHEADVIVASKMLYATHYFWAALELRVLVPDPARGAGFWFFTVSRSRTDGMTGLLGPLVRLRVRREAQQGTLTVLQSTKEKVESRRAG